MSDHDRFARWLYERFGSGPGWEQLDRGARIRWQEDADTTIRAAIRLSHYKIVER